MKKLVRHGAVWIDDGGFIYATDGEMFFAGGAKYKIVKRYGEDMVIVEEVR